MLENDQRSVTHADSSGRPSAIESDDEKDTVTVKVGDVRRRARVLQHY